MEIRYLKDSYGVMLGIPIQSEFLAETLANKYLAKGLEKSYLRSRTTQQVWALTNSRH